MPKLLTKGDVVLFALRKCAVASNATLTDVEPQSIADGLDDLEAMMAEWRARGIDIGYRFAEDEQTASPDDPTGVLPLFTSAVGYQLMLRVLADYGIEPPPRQEATVQTAYDALLTATLTVPSLKRRGDMPTCQYRSNSDPPCQSKTDPPPMIYSRTSAFDFFWIWPLFSLSFSR